MWTFFCITVSIQNAKRGQAQVAHTYNPSYSGSRNQEDHGLKPVQANISWDPISSQKKNITKRSSGSDSNSKSSCQASVSPRVQIPVLQKKYCWEMWRLRRWSMGSSIHTSFLVWCSISCHSEWKAPHCAHYCQLLSFWRRRISKEEYANTTLKGTLHCLSNSSTLMNRAGLWRSKTNALWTSLILARKTQVSNQYRAQR
jgi:hypothetical protein